MHFVSAETESSIFHGYSYSYIRNGRNIDFIGSVNERSGYTIRYNYYSSVTEEIVKRDLKSLVNLPSYDAESWTDV